MSLIVLPDKDSEFRLVRPDRGVMSLIWLSASERKPGSEDRTEG